MVFECERDRGYRLIDEIREVVRLGEGLVETGRLSPASKVDLLVRGICCLRPGLPGVSDNIRVISLVGRFLEHTRIVHFRNGGDDGVLTGSADLMPRNLDHRVETLFPVRDRTLQRALREDVLPAHLRDTVNARELRAGGTWERLEPADDAEPFDSQRFFIEHGGCWIGSASR